MAEPFDLAVHVLIEGQVQGVGYRAWTERQARARGLSGWVRNRASGAVEALFAGPGSEVTAMLQACQDGPPVARVRKIVKRDATSDEIAGLRRGRFQVRDTA